MRHIMPHAAATMLVQSASVFGYAVLTLAGLGILLAVIAANLTADRLTQVLGGR